jgi:lipopolysaccharide transport system permease protein
MKEPEDESWDLIIRPKSSLFDIDWRGIWQYRDLLRMFVIKDITVMYKQTILGPTWFVIQPIFTTLIFMLVFGNIAGISTDGTPKILFYLSGIVIWNYFSETFTKTSSTFSSNAAIFGKVYFPRLIMPLSQVITGLVKFSVQFALFIGIYLYFVFSGEVSISLNSHIFFFPLYVLLMAVYGLGFGLIFTSLTTKYRDLNFLIAFGVQLLMYATPVIYPVSTIPDKYKIYIQANPLTPILEGFKYGFLGAGEINLNNLLYTTLTGLIILFLGILVFNKTEKDFIDTV